MTGPTIDLAELRAWAYRRRAGGIVMGDDGVWYDQVIRLVYRCRELEAAQTARQKKGGAE